MIQGQGQTGGRTVPPFTPMLLVGLALRSVRPSLLQPVFDALMTLVRRRHPDILDRMAPYAQAAVCIDPIDLPFVLVLEPDPAAPRLTVRREIDPAEAVATVRGPLETLIALAEGKVDGDALFFSRQLVVEGDTEVVVALRNAVDGAGIDLLEDFATALGPLGRPVRMVAGAALGVFARLRQDIETVRQSLIAPALQGTDAQSARIAALEAEIKALRKQAKAQAKPARSAHA
ncbi:MAG: SCP2 sterol-binding domain-containing protein [Magnetospirillum sp.]|nr:SCP2 sterol-binding domain-containing protein [Magnetospirillum sp.]